MGGKDMGKDFLIGCYAIPDGIVDVKSLDVGIFWIACCFCEYLVKQSEILTKPSV